MFKVAWVSQRWTGFPVLWSSVWSLKNCQQGQDSWINTEGKVVNVGLNPLCQLLGLEKRRKLCQRRLWVHASRAPEQAGMKGDVLWSCEDCSGTGPPCPVQGWRWICVVLWRLQWDWVTLHSAGVKADVLWSCEGRSGNGPPSPVQGWRQMCCGAVKAAVGLGKAQRGHHLSYLALRLTTTQSFHSSLSEPVTGTSLHM